MNDRVRIYELARKMNVDSKVLIDTLRELGYDIKSHSSTIDSHAVGLLIAALGKKKQAQEQAETAKAASGKSTPGAKSSSKAAPPPAQVVKPRVLARYRPTPAPTGDAVESATAAPAAEVAPAVPEMSIAPSVEAPPEVVPHEEVPAPVELPEAVAPVTPPVEYVEEPIAIEDPVEPAEPAEPIKATTISSNPTSPPPVSKAVLEQRAQLEEIAKAQARAKSKKDEQAAAAASAAARQAEIAKNVQAKKDAPRGDRERGPGDNKDNTQDSHSGKQMRDAFSGQGRPTTPSAPAQPIRIAAPSFRATPPRPPKSRHAPVERHVQQPRKEDKKPAAAVVEIPKIVSITGAHTVKELAEKMAQPETEIIKRLFMKGVMRTVNQLVEPDAARDLAVEMGYELATQEDIDIAALVAAEEAAPKRVELTEEEVANQVVRPPIVTIMGHVDHGKTSLLDAIRQTKFLLTDSEHGGITQHMGAYHVEVPAEDGSLRQIVFLDTPGHEAFTAMRARGSKVTDIAILVVAADDGVMPQTIEAIDHAKAAGVPIIVAINKVDKQDADPDRVLTDLMNHGVVPDKFGGDTVTVNVSAKKRTGLDELLEMILLVAEIADLKANPEKTAVGSIIEAELSRGKGAVATALVANGTLREGDIIVAGSAWGRVRALFDDRGERVKAAGPSMPVEVLGLKEVPQAGDRFEVVADEQTARNIAEQRKLAEVDMRGRHVTLESLHDLMAKGEIKELDIIVKADVQGSAEALAEQLSKLTNTEVAVRVLRTASGDISETDVNLAASSNAIIIGFNVQPDTNARAAAEAAGVDIRTYNIIYQIIDDLQLAIQGLLQPIKKEVETGSAEIRALFKVGKNLMIAGCMVLDGKIGRGALIRIEREKEIIHEGKIETLKRFKDDAKEVAAGFECGMSFEKFTDLKEGDIVHAFVIQEIKRELPR